MTNPDITVEWAGDRCKVTCRYCPHHVITIPPAQPNFDLPHLCADDTGYVHRAAGQSVRIDPPAPMPGLFEPTWMTADQAADAARLLGGATFSVCPVCNGHWPDTGHLALTEAAVRSHAESHAPREYLEAIARLNNQLAELRKPPPLAGIDAALEALDAATESYRQALEAE